MVHFKPFPILAVVENVQLPEKNWARGLWDDAMARSGSDEDLEVEPQPAADGVARTGTSRPRMCSVSILHIVPQHTSGQIRTQPESVFLHVRITNRQVYESLFEI